MGTHPLLAEEGTPHAGAAEKTMEWEEDRSDDTLPVPQSFFHPRLETLDSFPKNFFTDSTFSGGGGDYSSTNYYVNDATGDQSTGLLNPKLEETLLNPMFEETLLDTDFEETLLNTKFDETLLNSEYDETLFLSSDEIFSQIAICSDYLDAAESKDTPHCPVKSENAAVEVKSEAATELNHYDIKLEKVECDIAKLKQEVDYNDDEDSLWSDFFSEDDPSEISKEYDELLQSLLTTPVDDFDLTLNVFNNVEEEEEGDKEKEGEAGSRTDGSEAKYCIDHILADHCYTLPWEESSVLLTPPNSSSDDSDHESDISSQSSVEEPCQTSLKSESSKFMQKTVKLKHKKDLKFVFSLKVKDSELGGVTAAPPGRSLLKKNQPNAASRQIVHQVFNKRAYRKRQKLNETAMAVQSLLNADQHGTQADKLMKMQTDRELHNSMERQRRIELKNEFDKLKSLIPDIAHSDKVSKLNVLNYSAEYVKKLERADLRLKLKKSIMKEKREKLLANLKQLSSC